MSNSVLISKENIQTILTAVVSQLYANIKAMDLSAADKTKLTILNYIVSTGDGSKFLSDNGTYKTIDVSNITNMSSKIATIYSIFNIVGNTYTLTLPADIQAKVNALNSTGDGSKVLADDGTYKDLGALILTTLTDTEVSTLISSVNALL